MKRIRWFVMQNIPMCRNQSLFVSENIHYLISFLFLGILKYTHFFFSSISCSNNFNQIALHFPTSLDTESKIVSHLFAKSSKCGFASDKYLLMSSLSFRVLLFVIVVFAGAVLLRSMCSIYISNMYICLLKRL